MKKSNFVTAIIIFSFFSLSGCMSFIGTIDQHDQVKDSKIYIGTRNAADMLFAQNGSPWLLLDLPFEMIADTIFLPYTIPYSIRKKEPVETAPSK